MKKRNRPSPQLQGAIDYYKANPGSSATVVMNKAGVSRATAFGAIKIVKEIGNVQDKSETKSRKSPKIQKEKKSERKGKKEIQRHSVRGSGEVLLKKEASPRPRRRVRGAGDGADSILVNRNNVPAQLRKHPSFNLEGFHLTPDKDLKIAGKMLWTDIVYEGCCPVCTKGVTMYKNAISFSDSGKREVHQRWAGKCRSCGIEVTINKGR